ncbi:MAG TPA: hypothetical protein VMH83_01765 [Candidatus Acidoferrum sp.]|nr:hypothetical protein [Candidatus Acidoferrum sp.]
MARTTKGQQGKTAAKANQAASQNQKTEFRFYDNRQNYLSFINTCNEKSAIAKRASKEFNLLRPVPPALRLYDAGMGDATVLSDCLRDLHHRFPTVPLLVVAKEISMEDVRIGLDKMVDRFCEHPATVLVLTNLNYADCRLMPSNVASANAMNWQEIKLEGTMSYGYKQQLESLHPLFAHGWETQTSNVTGNPLFKRPSVVVIYRQDHQILLDSVIPKPGLQNWYFDFILASQPWRARTSAKFKAEKIVAPLLRSLGPGGRMLVIQSCGKDPAEEVIHEFWPDEQPFPVDRHAIINEVRNVLGREARHYKFREEPDSKAIFSYRMHALPSEIGGASIGTSTLFAAWNASVYVNQIEDQRLEQVIRDGTYLKAAGKILQKYGGLHFNDEAFVISRYYD